MDPKQAALLVALGLAGGFMPRRGLFATSEAGDGDAGGSGGGAGGGAGSSNATDDEKKFSQKDLDTQLTSRLARESKAFEKKLAEATKTATDKAAAAEAKLAELTAKLEDAGKNDKEKELAQFQRELAKAQQAIADLTKERDEAKTAREAAEAKRRDHVRDTRLTEALLAAKVLPAAAAKAVKLMAAEAQIEVDDDGALTVTVGKRVFDDVSKAAAAWLEENPFLKAHPGGGAGTKNTGTGKGRTADDEMDERVLLGEAARDMARRRDGAAGAAKTLASIEADLD